jgi:hypothetical protein
MGSNNRPRSARESTSTEAEHDNTVTLHSYLKLERPGADAIAVLKPAIRGQIAVDRQLWAISDFSQTGVSVPRQNVKVDGVELRVTEHQVAVMVLANQKYGFMDRSISPPHLSATDF